jgi:uncharacterized membrane protein YcaP (DUF421 family)
MHFALKILISYCLLVIFFRLLGKKPMEYMTNYDMALVVVASNIVFYTIYSGNITQAVTTILALVVFVMVLDYIKKYKWISSIINGKSLILIDQGEIQDKSLKRIRMSREELMEKLKTKGYCNPCQIEYAILEQSGQINIIPKINPNHRDIVEGA